MYGTRRLKGFFQGLFALHFSNARDLKLQQCNVENRHSIVSCAFQPHVAIGPFPHAMCVVKPILQLYCNQQCTTTIARKPLQMMFKAFQIWLSTLVIPPLSNQTACIKFLVLDDPFWKFMHTQRKIREKSQGASHMLQSKFACLANTVIQ